MNELTLQTPECFQPLAQPSRYKASYGGRGSEKRIQQLEELLEKAGHGKVIQLRVPVRWLCV